MSKQELDTASDVVDVLGGSTKAAAMVGRRVQHATNWRAAGRFPPNTFLIFQRELKRRGYYAPPSLWGIWEYKPEGNDVD